MPMAASQQPSLEITRLSIRESSVVAEHTQTMDLIPRQNSVVGNIRDQKTLMIAKPNRTFQPSTTIKESFKLSIEKNQRLETRINNFDLGFNKLTAKNHDALPLTKMSLEAGFAKPDHCAE